MKDPRDIVLAPVISEKSYRLIEESNTYTFRVHPQANKVHIRQAVEAIFTNVEVVKVNTVNRKGKRKKNRRDWSWGKQPDRKHAMVQLRPGDRIPIFEGV
ncbi:MAG: 50S ribosomal protein L23 [Actinobacteria bacterium ATB1]|nr:50S ribosomal protein L23 [Actinobacteria bacterium ATB1]